MPPLLKSRLFLSLSMVVAIVGAYALVGFVLAPGILRDQAQNFVRENYGRELAIGEIRIQPFKLQLEVRDAVLPDVDGQPMLGFQRLFVDLQIASLWNQAFTFRQITVDAPRVRAVVRPGGALNLADLAPPKKPAGPNQPLPGVWVQQLGIRQGQVTYVDQARRTPFEQQFRDVGFELADFHTTPEGGDFRFSARVRDDATIEWKGHFALAPVIASRGEFKLGSLRLPWLQELLGDVLPFGTKSGTLNLAGAYRIALAQPLELEVDLPSVEFRDLGLLARGIAEPWVQIPSIVVSGTKVALPAQTLTVERAVVDAMQAQVWLNADRSVNLATLFSRPTDTEAPVSAAPSVAAPAVQPPWSVKVGDIDLKRAAIEFEDRAIAPGTRFKLAPVNMRLSNASLDLSQALPLTLDAVINDHTRFDVKGTLTPGPLAASLDIRLAKARLTALQPYVQPRADLAITAGELDVAGKLEIAPAGGKNPRIGFAADIVVDGFATVDKALKQDFLGFSKVEIGKLRYAMEPDSLSIERIGVREPYAKVIVGRNQVVNVVAVLNPQGTAKSVTSGVDKVAPEAPPPLQDATANTLPIRIGEVRIDGMRLNFTDNFIQPNFSADVRQLSGKVTGLSSARDARAKADLKGNLGEFSPVSITGELQPFAFDRYTNVQLRFENIPLPIFNPYSGSLAGYNIDKGQLTTELQYKIQNRRLDAQHRIRVDQLEWGEATPSKREATLPVKFATSLLKDRNGVISLDVPVGGTLDDPNFRIGPIVWQVIGNLITKAVTAPFTLLGALAKGAEAAQFVEFDAGDAVLEPAIAGHLAALGKTLSEKPTLKVDVPIGTLAELDRPALMARAYNAGVSAAVAARFGGPPGAEAPAYAALDSARKIEVLTAFVQARTGKAPQLPAQSEGASQPASAAPVDTKTGEAAILALLEQAARATITLPETSLAQLGSERALAVERALLAGTGLEPARVFKVRVGKVSARDGRVRFELGLQ